MSSGAEQVVEAIVSRQRDLIGGVALKLASGIDGLDVADDGSVTISGDDIETIERVVVTFSKFSGPLGIRMCFDAAEPVLGRHPELQVPSFKGMQ